VQIEEAAPKVEEASLAAKKAVGWVPRAYDVHEAVDQDRRVWSPPGKP